MPSSVHRRLLGFLHRIVVAPVHHRRRQGEPAAERHRLGQHRGAARRRSDRRRIGGHLGRCPPQPRAELLDGRARRQPVGFHHAHDFRRERGHGDGRRRCSRVRRRAKYQSSRSWNRGRGFVSTDLGHDRIPAGASEHERSAVVAQGARFGRITGAVVVRVEAHARVPKVGCRRPRWRGPRGA